MFKLGNLMIDRQFPTILLQKAQEISAKRIDSFSRVQIDDGKECDV